MNKPPSATASAKAKSGGADSAPESRAGRLQAGVDSLTVSEPLAEAEGLLLKIGVGLPVTGIALILVAWWTTSDSAYVADQIPALISGGILGLGLLIVGAGLFLRYSLTRLFRFWLARVIVEQQAQTDRVVDALVNLESAVRENRLKQ